MFRLFSFLLFYVMIPVVLQGQEVGKVQHLLVGNGMTNNHIKSMVQDGTGMMWIATESGLNSYDGYTSFNYNSANSGLNANMVNTVCFHDRKLWIATTGSGVSVMDEHTHNISQVDMGRQQISNIQNFAEAADGGLWMMSRNGIVRYHSQNRQFHLLKSSHERNAFRCLVDDGHGHLIVGNYYRGLSLIDIRTGKQTPLTDDRHLVDNATASRMSKDHRGNIWISTNYGLWRVSNNGRLERFDRIGVQIIREAQPVGENELWVATESEVKRIDLTTYEPCGTVPVASVQRIYQDPFHNVWLGTVGFGIYFVSHEMPMFREVSTELTQSLVRVGNELYVGGEGKVMKFKDGKLQASFPVRLRTFTGLVLSIDQEDERHLVMAVGSRLLRMDRRTGEVSEIKCEGQSVTAITFYNDHDNSKLWVTADNGIFSLSHGQVSSEQRLNRVLGKQMTNGIRRDRQGKLWIGTIDNGLYVFSPQEKLIRHFNQQNGFFTNSIQHLYEDDRGRIWLCTPDGVGLIANTQNIGQCEIFGMRQGLRDPFIRCLHQDQNDNVWIGTNNGISLLDLKRRTVFNFDNNDGIPVSNFSGGMTLMPDGTMYVTSVEGLCAFDTKMVTQPKQTSQVSIQSCIALNANVEQWSNRRLQADRNQTFTLQRDENSVRIVFAVADLAQSRQVEYACRVDGLMDEWTILDENRITFRGLAPGQYVVQIRARLHGQTLDSATLTQATIVVPGPLWLSWPARMLYAAVIITLVGYGFRRYKHHLQLVSDLEMEHRQKLTEERQGQERLQFFTNVAHELRTPLTLIFGPLEELAHSQHLSLEDHQKVSLLRGSADRLLMLINQLMDFRKAETHNRRLQVKHARLQPLVEKIGSNFAQANRNPNVTYRTEADASVPSLLYDEEVMTLILTNLMSNAMKYTSQGRVTLSMDYPLVDGQHLVRLRVEDTGCGIPAKDLPHIFDRYYQAEGVRRSSGTGIGLALVRTMSELHRVKLSVESKESMGTTFTLMLDPRNDYPEAMVCPDKQVSHPETPTPLQERQISAAHKTSQPIILVVEDNTDINNYIAQSLAPDYIVVQASDGEAGLRAAKANLPDLIVCDIMMPVMDGITMTRLVKQDMMTSHIPIVMLTAKTTTDDRVEGYESGADSYLTKPFSITMLKTRIANLMESRQNLARHIMQQLGGPAAGHNHHDEAPAEKGQDAHVPSASDMEKTDQTPKLGKLDQRFLDQLNAIVKTNLRNPKLNLPYIAAEMSISQSTLYRKMKALTGTNTNEYIRKMRLAHALKLITQEGRNISEAAYESGFNDLAYFRQSFRQEYGTTPSDYLSMP
ncbi:MAG: response regulator [Prevotella sp.]|nr:response regulator [Prevotella sp.]